MVINVSCIFVMFSISGEGGGYQESGGGGGGAMKIWGVKGHRRAYCNHSAIPCMRWYWSPLGQLRSLLMTLATLGLKIQKKGCRCRSWYCLILLEPFVSFNMVALKTRVVLTTKIVQFDNFTSSGRCSHIGSSDLGRKFRYT
jgi:hypothetical protein